MTEPDGDTHSPPHQRRFEADHVEVRQETDESGVFELRMPVASTGEVRNENDDPLTRDEIEGMAQQINDGNVGVFLDHGQTPIGGRNRYSIGERAGQWQDAEVVSAQDADSDADLLEATARLMDPDELPDIPARGFLGTVKELAKRDMGVSSSIGWADDDSAPGGVDLMEASIVGIPADPRTHTDADAAQVVARAATEAGADPEDLVDAVQAAVEDSDDMSTEDTDTPAEEDQAGDDPEEPDERQEAPEWAARMLELQEQTVDALQAMREDDMDDDEDDDDTEENEGGHGDDEDDEDDENAADTEQSDVPEDVRDEIESLRSELDALRSGGMTADDVDTPDEEQDADDDDQSDTDAATSATKEAL